MYGLARNELKFALIISSAHVSQHVYYRILPPLIPVLAVALEYPLWQLGLLISIYSIGMGVTQAPLGLLADRIDRKYLLPTGIIVTGSAYLLFAVSPALAGPVPAIAVFGYTFEGGYLLMTLSMLVVGAGLAVVHPTSYPMISDNIAADRKGKVLGLFGASSKFGDAATPTAVAGLILLLDWQQIIFLFGIVGIAYGILLFAVLAQDAFVTVPAQQRPSTEETDEGREDTDNRSVLYPILAVYGFFISSMLSTRGLNTFLPAFVVAVYAYSVDLGSLTLGAESVANLYFAILLLSGGIMQLFLGGVTDARDPRIILIWCMIAATIGLVLLSIVPLSPLLLGGVIILLGSGLYGVNPARDALISSFSPAESEGRTFGYVFTATSLTAAPLPALIGYILETAGMRTGFLLLAIGPVLAIGCILLLYSNIVYSE